MVLWLYGVLLSYHILSTRAQYTQFNCIGEDACKGKVLFCPALLPCKVVCSGKSACIDTSIVGTEASDIYVACNGEDACKPVFVSCGSGDCIIDCQLGNKVCHGLTVNLINAKSFQCYNECPALVKSYQFTEAPTRQPTNMPTILTTAPSNVPSTTPTASPTAKPTLSPTKHPTKSPNLPPTSLPTISPSDGPIKSPSASPTPTPSEYPTPVPTPFPTAMPIIQKVPTLLPTLSPSSFPSRAPFAAPTESPSFAPSSSPTTPTQVPTPQPTTRPSLSPSTTTPTFSPSLLPSQSPTQPTIAVADLSMHPTTESPTEPPTSVPTLEPTTTTTTTIKSIVPSRPLPPYTIKPTMAVQPIDNNNSNASVVQQMATDNILWWICGALSVFLSCVVCFFLIFCFRIKHRSNSEKYKQPMAVLEHDASSLQLIPTISSAPRDCDDDIDLDDDDDDDNVVGNREHMQHAHIAQPRRFSDTDSKSMDVPPDPFFRINSNAASACDEAEENEHNEGSSKRHETRKMFPQTAADDGVATGMYTTRSSLPTRPASDVYPQRHHHRHATNSSDYEFPVPPKRKSAPIHDGSVQRIVAEVSAAASNAQINAEFRRFSHQHQHVHQHQPQQLSMYDRDRDSNEKRRQTVPAKVVAETAASHRQRLRQQYQRLTHKRPNHNASKWMVNAHNRSRVSQQTYMSVASKASTDTMTETMSPFHVGMSKEMQDYLNPPNAMVMVDGNEFDRDDEKMVEIEVEDTGNTNNHNTSTAANEVEMELDNDDQSTSIWKKMTLQLYDSEAETTNAGSGPSRHNHMKLPVVPGRSISIWSSTEMGQNEGGRGRSHSETSVLPSPMMSDSSAVPISVTMELNEFQTLPPMYLGAHKLMSEAAATFDKQPSQASPQPSGPSPAMMHALAPPSQNGQRLHRKELHRMMLQNGTDGVLKLDGNEPEE